VTPDEQRAEALAGLAADRWRAHQLLFPERHPVESAPAHRELVAAIYNEYPRIELVCFRGMGKTTNVEEAVVLKAAFREFKNVIICGASYQRACERIAAIQRIFEQNEDLEQVFGRLGGEGIAQIWQQGKLVLTNGVCIQALGRDQAMRGTKHLDIRPDFAIVDDIEDKDEVLTAKGRQRTWDWFIGEFLPALDHPLFTPVRVLGTIQHEDSFVVRLMREKAWRHFIVPIMHRNEKETGDWEATWPGKFPLSVIEEMRRGYAANMAVWEREYMCNAAAVSQRDFDADMIRVVEREPTWQAIYAMYDPARTTNRASATTGKAVWSWRRNRLVVWDGGGERWKPDEIIADIFATAERYDPVFIGVEEDGLNEFIRQPLRQEMARRGYLIPVKPMRAPRGKLDFIRGLQPFFAAGEVEFAKPLPELAAQLLSFPTGDIDGPNALAYALLMRPGAPIYEDFRDEHVAHRLTVIPFRPVYLAANAREGIVAAILAQVVDGQIRILADFVREGDPAERVHEIHMEAAIIGDAARVGPMARPTGYEALKNPEASLYIGRQPPVWVIPGWHYEKWMNVGLEQAVRRLPAQVQRGGEEADGREFLREAFRRVSHGEPAVAISENCRWTLRALAGGYSRGVRKSGLVAEDADPGPYRVLMEGLEAFLGMIRLGVREADDDEATQAYSYDRQGRRYKSVMPAR
jgi:hypothetical protein